MNYKLRKHQKKTVKLAQKALLQHSHVLIGAPTGFGKSLCILDMVSKALANGERILVIAPYRKLVFQLMDTFSSESPALLMGSDSYGDPKTSPLIVASLSTLSRRLNKDMFAIGGLDAIFIDEAHLSFNIPDNTPTKSVAQLYKRYWNTCKWVGFTATPITANGYRLEGWDHSIYKYTTAWLIKKGWLAEFKYYSVPEIDTSNLKIQSNTGDYSTSDMESVTNIPTAIKSVYDNYLKFGEDKKTLIFAASIAHATILMEYFKEKGAKVRVIHSNLPENQQRRILEEYKSNVFDVLINIGMLTTGFDDPEIETLMVARPVGSRRLFLQVVGRSLRLHENIPTVTIVDMTSAYLKCGLPDDLVNWNREKKKRGEDTGDDDNNTPDITDVTIECRSCNTVFRMVDAKREKLVTEELIELTYFCPACNEIADIKTTNLEVAVVQKIQTSSDINLSANYSMDEVHTMLGELIKANTQKAKTSWGFYIHKTCIAADRKAYKMALYGYAQKVYSSKQAWKRIMGVYGD